MQKLFFIIVFGLVVIANSGCTTKKTYTDIEPHRLEVLRVGQKAQILTHKEVLINNVERTRFELVVTDVNAERIQGDLVPYRYVDGDLLEESVPVEVKAENIKHIKREGVLLLGNQDPKNPLNWDSRLLFLLLIALFAVF